jgi:hypothetical protein
MAFAPEASVMTGLAVGAVVVAVHSQATPRIADIQAMPAGNKDIETAERKATIASVGIVSAISLMAKDPVILLIGSIVTVGMALWSRHANWSMDGRYMSPADGSGAGSANSPVEKEQVADTAPYTMFQSQSEFVGS